MALLLETTLGDLVIDLDVEGSPSLCRNVLKLAKARYYTSTLIYNVQPNRFCQCGDPTGDGSGGACIYALLDNTTGNPTGNTIHNSSKRFIQSKGRRLTLKECQEKGRVVATEMNFVPDTVGSQFLITVGEGEGNALDGYNATGSSSSSLSLRPLSLGWVAQDDNNILDKMNGAYCDANGRPYADVRIVRALVIHDPFEDPEGMDLLLQRRGVKVVAKKRNDDDKTDNQKDTLYDSDTVTASPEWSKPPEEVVEDRIQASEVDLNEEEEDPQKAKEREEEIARKQDKSRAVMLEMLGDLPSADLTAPENVLFVCKLNSITEDEDLELIFSRFDPKCKAEIIRDQETGDSLQYAFVEFTTKQQCVDAYFKMNNVLVDDRRIKVDFSQSVSKTWRQFRQNQHAKTFGKGKMTAMPSMNNAQNGGGNRRNGNGGLDNRQRPNQQQQRNSFGQEQSSRPGRRRRWDSGRPVQSQPGQGGENRVDGRDGGGRRGVEGGARGGLQPQRNQQNRRDDGHNKGLGGRFQPRQGSDGGPSRGRNDRDYGHRDHEDWYGRQDRQRSARESDHEHHPERRSRYSDNRRDVDIKDSRRSERSASMDDHSGRNRQRRRRMDSDDEETTKRHIPFQDEGRRDRRGRDDNVSEKDDREDDESRRRRKKRHKKEHKRRHKREKRRSRHDNDSDSDDAGRGHGRGVDSEGKVEKDDRYESGRDRDQDRDSDRHRRRHNRMDSDDEDDHGAKLTTTYDDDNNKEGNDDGEDRHRRKDRRREKEKRRRRHDRDHDDDGEEDDERRERKKRRKRDRDRKDRDYDDHGKDGSDSDAAERRRRRRKEKSRSRRD